MKRYTINSTILIVVGMFAMAVKSPALTIIGAILLVVGISRYINKSRDNFIVAEKNK